MHKFNDTPGREWIIKITFGELRRIRDELSFDLTKILDGGEESQRITDPILLVDIIYLLIEAKANERSVTPEDFGRSLDGETLEKATEAMTGALIDFFPPARRDLYRRAIQAGQRLSEITISQALEAVEKIEAKTSTSKKPDGDLPESLASAPATSTA